MSETQQPESSSLETVQLKLDREFCNKLTHQAQKAGVPFNEYVCTIITDWMESSEKQQQGK